MMSYLAIFLLLAITWRLWLLEIN